MSNNKLQIQNENENENDTKELISLHNLEETGKNKEIEYFDLIKELNEIFLPECVFVVSIVIYELITMHFIGYQKDSKSNKNQLQAFGFCSLYIDSFLITFIYEFLATFEVFGCNAYGLDKIDLFKTYFRRGYIITTVFFSILIVINYFLAPYIFSLIITNHEVLQYVNEYFSLILFFIPFEVNFSFVMRYLNITGVCLEIVIILASTIILHPLWCYILINLLGLGVKGAVISFLISSFLNSLNIMLLLIFKYPEHRDIFYFDRESFRKWGEYIKFVLSNFLMISSGFWINPIIAYIALWIGSDSCSIFIMLTKLNTVATYFYFSYEATANILVAKNLTSESYCLKTYIQKLYLLGFFISCFFSLIYFIFRGNFILLLLDDKILADSAQLSLIMLAAGTVFEYSVTILIGIIRALRLQFIGNIINVISTYIIIIGLSILLGKYYEMGVNGIYISILIGNITSTVSYIIILINEDLELIKSKVITELDNEQNEEELS